MALQLRPARLEDYRFFARWFPMLESGDRTPTPEMWGASIVPETSIAEVHGEPAGYCRAQIFGPDGYIRHVVVDPSVRRSGVGRALLEHAADAMRTAGCTRWRLNVKPDNKPAMRLYTALGLRVSHHCASMRFSWSLLKTLGTPPPGLSVVEPSATQRAMLESKYDLPVGQLATSECTYVRAVQADALRGVALFNAAFPGAFPFRADSTDAAISLLHGLRPLATQDAMGIVVEDDETLDALMVDAGARVPFRFVHIRGPL